MMQFDRMTLGKKARELGFVRDTFEKVCRLADVLEWAWKHGAKLDSWSEYFDHQRWMDALAACGLNGDFYAHRERAKDEVFPWAVPDVGVRREFLWHERELCYQSVTTPDCRTRCSACGANQMLERGRTCG